MPVWRLAGALALATVWSAPAAARVSCPPSQAPPATAGTFSVSFENDLFNGQDRNYTNGVRLSWVSGDLSSYLDDPRLERAPAWVRGLIDRLPFVNVACIQRNVALAVGQKIFTPEDISRRALILDDRPYAGWLYGSAAFHNKRKDRLDSIEIQLGVVGPASLGEETQNFVHRLRDIDEAQGWDNQLENEPGFVMFYEQRRRLLATEHGPSGLGYDLIGHAGGALGNVYVFANAGLEARFGWRIPVDFGTTLIRPGGDPGAPVDSSDPRLALRADQRFGIHVFAAVTGRAIARDIFLDGNTFTDSHEVDKRNLVGDLILGTGLTYQRFKLTYAQVFRTEEFAGEGGGHEFGSVTLSYSF